MCGRTIKRTVMTLVLPYSTTHIQDSHIHYTQLHPRRCTLLCFCSASNAIPHPKVNTGQAKKKQWTRSSTLRFPRFPLSRYWASRRRARAVYQWTWRRPTRTVTRTVLSHDQEYGRHDDFDDMPAPLDASERFVR